MKRTGVIILVVLSIALCAACTKTTEKNSEEEKTTEEIVYRQSELDRTSEEKDISRIDSMEITEARIVWADKIYRTTDDVVINEIKELISKVELVEASEEFVEELTNTESEVYGDDYNLYLVNNDKIVYGFEVECYKFGIYCGGKLYEPNDDFTKTVLNYCRKEFWY